MRPSPALIMIEMWSFPFASDPPSLLFPVVCHLFWFSLLCAWPVWGYISGCGRHRLQHTWSVEVALQVWSLETVEKLFNFGMESLAESGRKAYLQPFSLGCSWTTQGWGHIWPQTKGNSGKYILVLVCPLTPPTPPSSSFLLPGSPVLWSPFSASCLHPS